MLTLALALTLAPQGGPVVINEFCYDNLGGDVLEFVELYNRSGGPIDISGWVLDSADPNGPNAAYTIPNGTTLAADGRWTIGADLANPGNIDQVVGTSNLWENSNESLTLRDPNGRIVDTLVYEAARGLWDPTLAEGGVGVKAQYLTSQSRFVSFQRCPDGNDTDDNGRDFHILPATPAAPNFATSGTPYLGDYDSLIPGESLNQFRGTFTDGFAIDPTVAADGNPNVIPASPTGGNAAIFWDPTGGGNANYFESNCIEDVQMFGCVYIDGGLTPAGEGETWNIGVRGAVGAFAHHTDPGGTFYSSIGGNWLPGNTGLAVCWQRTDTYNKLFLVDYADGGSTTVLGEIDIVAGVNDGWQQFRFTALGSSAAMRWGNDTIQATGVTAGAGGIYIGYREFRADNSTTRPPTLDDFSIISLNDNTSYFGGPTPSRLGDPMLDFDGAGALGTTNDVIGRSLPGTAVLAMGLRRHQPLPLGPGFIPGSELLLYVLDTSAAQVGTVFSEYPLTIPSKNELMGAQLSFQLFQFDWSLPYSMPLVHSRGMTLTIVNN